MGTTGSIKLNTIEVIIASYPTTPSQIPACGITAQGSSKLLALHLSQPPSSSVENLNSRLRQYFFLRRQIGHGYLDLLRFYFNHRRYERSLRPERTGYSPAELMTGKNILIGLRY